MWQTVGVCASENNCKFTMVFNPTELHRFTQRGEDLRLCIL